MLELRGRRSGPPTVRTTSTRWRRRWRALLWRWRIRIAAACLAAAAALIPTALRPPTAPTVPVVVAARELPAGTTLAAEDVRTVRIGADVAPSPAPDREDAVLGQRTAVGVPAGTPLVPGVVHGVGIRPAVPPGLTLAAVRLADPGVARLLRPGDRVTLLAGRSDPTGTETGTETSAETGTETGTERLVARALVVEIQGDAAEASSGGLLAPSSAVDVEPLILLAVSTEEATRLAGAALTASITAVLVE